MKVLNTNIKDLKIDIEQIGRNERDLAAYLKIGVPFICDKMIEDYVYPYIEIKSKK
jgi:hypothetical protein